MKIIAIDSSGMTASVAILDEEITIAEYTVNHKKTHSQTLLPMLQEICRMTEQELSKFDGIAISKGPGSFTGLRIGSATAKGLGFALNLPVMEVMTTDALAYNMYGTDRIICPLMDARREQVYTGLYKFTKEDTDYRMETLLEASALPVEDIIGKINNLGTKVVFLGDGVPVYIDKIKELTAVDYIFAGPGKNRQSASSVGALGLKLLKEGKTVTAAEHVPEYLRLSQAERERNERNSENA